MFAQWEERVGFDMTLPYMFDMFFEHPLSRSDDLDLAHGLAELDSELSQGSTLPSMLKYRL